MSGKTIRSAEILSVGTELLLGEIANTDAAYLSQRLAALGVSVYRHTVVGDNESRLRAALLEALGRADLVVTTGGLGPTYDDMTKETIAAVFGRPLVRHAESEREIRGFFESLHIPMTENNLKQADLPEDCIPLKNDVGTAPGVFLRGEINGEERAVCMLPGPPAELTAMWETCAEPVLRTMIDARVIFSRNIMFYGIGESAVEDALRPLIENAVNPSAATYCGDDGVRIRVTASAGTAAEASALADSLAEKLIASPVGRYIWAQDAESPEAELISRLRERGMTIATAESCTGGLIGKRITDVPGSSDVYLGGVIAYANSVKTAALNVSPDTLREVGAVSERTALEMARGARALTGADIAVSTTGIAGPGGGTPNKPVGTVWIGISSARGDRAVLMPPSPHPRGRDRVRKSASTRALMEAIAELQPDGE